VQQALTFYGLASEFENWAIQSIIDTNESDATYASVGHFLVAGASFACSSDAAYPWPPPSFPNSGLVHFV
jgi:hypothetical protein